MNTPTSTNLRVIRRKRGEENLIYNMLSINDEKGNTQIALFEIKKTKIVNERQYIISLFVEEINKERIGTKYKLLTGRAVAMKCSHIPTKDLYHFMSVAKDYKNRKGSFGKAFFGMLKLK